MAYCSKAWLVLSLLTLVPALHADNTPDVARRANAVCSAIQKQISSASGVYYIGRCLHLSKPTVCDRSLTSKSSVGQLRNGQPALHKLVFSEPCLCSGSRVNGRYLDSGMDHERVLKFRTWLTDHSTKIKVIGSKRSPFAVISGGHASNPGFSSTTGVLISMARMKQIIPASNRKTVVIGSGNVSLNTDFSHRGPCWSA